MLPAGQAAASPEANPAALLAPAALAELCRVAQRLEAALGGPQDVEFAQDAAGKLWLVQTWRSGQQIQVDGRTGEVVVLGE
ncbi:MAG: hypothetical protein EOO59_08765 [Hymenobacter sp.]|nr:MAG: hypothetical protein EOO59_08765 [Hymenobacter sp.]